MIDFPTNTNHPTHQRALDFIGAIYWRYLCPKWKEFRTIYNVLSVLDCDTAHECVDFRLVHDRGKINLNNWILCYIIIEIVYHKIL